MESSSSTQLADSRPQFDTTLRVALPVNVPQRTGKKSRDDLIRTNAFSPAALAVGKKTLTSLVGNNGKVALTPLAEKSTSIAAPNMEQDAQIKTSIRDFSVLAFSSKRAGKKDVEATAYLSLGVIYDNQGNYLAAIENYKLYLEICEEIGDAFGGACACNCLGVNYMLLATPPSDAGLLQGFRQDDTNIDHLQQAIIYHSKHNDIGPDAGGRFVANTNLGLCLAMIGDVAQSAKHQQDALRIAIKMQTLYGQSIAVANLGLLALIRSDFSTSRTCFEQHLQLVQALKDPEAEVNAFKMLAKVSSAENRSSDALEYLEQARRIAAREGYRNELRRIHCLIGTTRGAMEFGFFAERLVEKIAGDFPLV